MTDAFDLAVIGGGSAGLTATVMAARLGARVLLVDKTELGGDCLHYGCVPSKALIASARLAHQMRHGSAWGLQDHAPVVDLKRVMDRIRDIQAQIGRFETPEALREDGAEVAMGGARFEDAETVIVGGDRRVQAKRVIIATGSRAVAPKIEGLTDYIDHVSLFGLEQLPERLVVIGGGPIGCEMGQAMARLGAKVTILQRGPRLVKRELPEISERLKQVLIGEGVEVLTDRSPERVEGRTVVLSDRRIEADRILVAAGRRPTIEGLNLEAAGVETDRGGIVVDETLRTSQKNIYAVGDVNGGPQFTHWAEHEARIATRNALFVGSAKRTDLLPRVTFTDPEIASVGEPPGGTDTHTHRVPFEKVDRAVCEGAPGGFLLAVVDGKGRIKGAHAIGHQAGEVLAELVLAMAEGITLSRLGEVIHAYPTITRASRRLADERFLAHGIEQWKTRLFGKF